jgi:hypothetical protein
MTAMDDAFGEFPDRPDHPDFWKMSSAVLRLDGRMHDGDGSTQAFVDTVNEYADIESLTYLAKQRVLRLNAPDHLKPLLMTIYLDAFITGCEYSR